MSFPMSSTPLTLFTPSRPFRRVTLELSLKPFYDDSPQTRRRVAEELFRQWMPLCHRAEVVEVMLWIGDGNEILDWRGNVDDCFEWGYWLGSANHVQPAATQLADEKDPDPQGIGFHTDDRDPQARGLHRRPYLYRENPARFSYRWLAGLVDDVKCIGTQLTGKPIHIGLTFDPGPEFTISEFKYRRHPELCPNGLKYGLSKAFVPCTARLHADPVAYAAFPDGIPEDTGLGTFLGRQLAHLKSAIDFDFVWFSNGFGFGTQTWSYRGTLFDGTHFSPELARRQREAILGFWGDFRHETSLPIRTRGTNLTTGVDLASDGVPLRDIYKTANVTAPVNSPWAALDSDFGLELAGWMSHVAEVPDGHFAYRFYAHDPWWMNSPWLDRYERRAHDIFLPLCVSRLNEMGTVKPADDFNVLTADNSLGEMPDVVAAEVCAHVLRTRELAPDALAPLLWIYPSEEYHSQTFGENPDLATVYCGDWLVRGFINNGLPLNTVASSGNFLADFARRPQKFAATVLVTPVPASNSPLRTALLRHAKSGGKILLYGPVLDDDQELCGILGLEPASGQEGELNLGLCETTHQFFAGEPIPARLRHSSVFSAGALTHRFRGDGSAQKQLAWAENANDLRALAVFAALPHWNGGALGWLRGSVSADETKPAHLLPAALDSTQFFHSEALGRALLARLGTLLQVRREGEARSPIFAFARSNNAWVLAAYNPDDAQITLNFPQGAPLPLGTRVRVNKNGGHFQPQAAQLSECRLFVQQTAESTIVVQEIPSIMVGVRRRWLIKGLKNARLRFFPETDCSGHVEFLSDPAFPYFTGDFQPSHTVAAPDGRYLEVEDISGILLISW